MTGIGIDIVDVKRVREMLDRHGERFLERCFRPAEIKSIAAEPAPAEAAAACWAAKEALLKALSGRIRYVPYRSIEVVHHRDGNVGLRLHDRARELWCEKGGAALHISLSSTSEHAAALVVID